MFKGAWRDDSVGPMADVTTARRRFRVRDIRNPRVQNGGREEGTRVTRLIRPRWALINSDSHPEGPGLQREESLLATRAACSHFHKSSF